MNEVRGEGARGLIASRVCSFTVWTAWAAMFAAAITMVARYGHDVPYYDEWSLVPVLGGTQRVDLAWLWQPRNGHRILVPKLALLALHSATGWDSRDGMFACVILLGAASAALISAAAARRGRFSYADAIFPLLVLNWGHYDNFLWCWQLTQVMPVATAYLLLAAVVRWAFAPPLWVAIASSVAVVTLPLSGVPGLAIAPGFGLWLLEVARRRWVAGERGQGAAIATITAAGMLLVPLYFVNLQNTGIESPRLVPSIRRGVAFLAHGLGPAADAVRRVPAGFVLVMLAGATIWAARSLRDPDRDRRGYGAALLCVAVAIAGLTLSVAISRPERTFPDRYFMFAVPALCWAYLSWELARPRAIVGVAGALLLGVSLAAAIYNTPWGHHRARGRGDAMAAFEADLRAGRPTPELLALHQRAFLPSPERGGGSNHDGLARSFAVLRDHNVGAFSALVPTPAYLEADVRSRATISFVSRDAGGPGWHWTFAAPQPLAGVRIRRPTSIPRQGEWALDWRRREGEWFRPHRRFVHTWRDDDVSQTAWIVAPVLEFWHYHPQATASDSPPELTLLLDPGDVSPTTAPVE